MNTDEKVSLRSRTTKNIFYSFVLKVFVRIVSFIAAILLLRILDPADFGIVAMAQVLITMFQFFETFGINSAIIQRENVNAKVYSTGLTIKFVVSFLLLVSAFFIAPFWGKFYGQQSVVTIVRVLTLTLIISSFTFVPDTYLRKSLNFKKSIVPDMARIMSYSVAAVAFAMMGLRFWSLIYATLFGEVIRAMAYYIIQPTKLEFSFDKRIARELIGYGKWMVLGSLIYWSYSYLDNAIVGKVLGVTILGFYMVAYRWGNWIVDNIVMALSPVLFPTFSKIQNNIPSLRKSYLEVLKYLSLLIFPIAIGLIFLSDMFVLNVMGNKWEPVIVPLQILACGGLFRALQSVGGPIFLAVGKPKVSTYVMCINLVIILFLIYPFLLWKGIIGVSLAVALAFIITFFISIKLTNKLLEIKWHSIAQVLRDPLLAGLSMGTILIISKKFFPHSFIYFLLLVWMGGSAYLAIIYALTHGQIYMEIKSIFREVINRK